MIYVLSYKQTQNLGDAVQTLALIEYLKSINIDLTNINFVDKQALVTHHYFNKKNSKYIINGWHRREEEPLPKEAFFVSIHASKEHLSLINKNQIIGCRDIWTLENCKKLNIQSYLTGCVTITIPVRSKISSNKILDIDINNKSDNHIQLTQKIDKFLSWSEQLSLAKIRLKEMSESDLVRTTRLHCLLPCIAMGIPVILESIPHYQPERFSFFDKYIPFNKVIELNSGVREQLIDVWNLNAHKILDKLYEQ